MQLNGVGVAPVIDITPSVWFWDAVCGMWFFSAIDDFKYRYCRLDCWLLWLVYSIKRPILWCTRTCKWTTPVDYCTCQSVDVFVDYAPMDSISDASFLTVSSNDPYLPEALVTQDGLGKSTILTKTVSFSLWQGLVTSSLQLTVHALCTMILLWWTKTSKLL